MANFCTLSGLKQHECISLQLWGSELKLGLPGLASRRQQGCVPSGSPWVETACSFVSSCLVQLRGHLHSRARGSFLCLRSQEGSIFSLNWTADSVTTPSLGLTLLPLSYKDTCDSTGLTSMSRALTKSHLLSPFHCIGSHIPKFQE